MLIYRKIKKEFLFLTKQFGFKYKYKIPSNMYPSVLYESYDYVVQIGYNYEEHCPYVFIQYSKVDGISIFEIKNLTDAMQKFKGIHTMISNTKSLFDICNQEISITELKNVSEWSAIEHVSTYMRRNMKQILLNYKNAVS